MSSTKIEFVVQMTCDSCVQAVKKSFENVEGVKNIDVNLKSGSVVVDTNLSTEEIQKIFDSSGQKAVVKGYAGLQAGVAILEAGSTFIKGVVRFIQLDDKTCIVDGTVDGLRPGRHSLSVHECGDISKGVVETSLPLPDSNTQKILCGCDNVGDFFQANEKVYNGRIYGDLGEIAAANNGRANFRFEDNVINLPDIIGRSLVLSDGLNPNKRLVCGIIARSSGLFQNPKMICACDGVSIWDEQKAPKSGL